jgi:uncharacterized protein
MREKQSSLFPTLMVLAVTAAASACTNREPNTPMKENPMTTLNTRASSADVVRAFFAAFGKGDLEGIVGTFHPDAEIVAVHKAARSEGELYGSYSGKEGAKTFVATLGSKLETQAFSVDHLIAEGDVAFASGSFVHKVKSTGKPFSSEWALRCIVKDGKILRYTFFEDSAAYLAAARP